MRYVLSETEVTHWISTYIQPVSKVLADLDYFMNDLKVKNFDKT